MSRRKSVQELVRPLKKLSLLVGTRSPEPLARDSASPSTAEALSPLSIEHEQHDIVSWLPREIALSIFGLLPFSDLVTVQLTCRIWKRIAKDASLWRTLYRDLNRRHPDLYLHKRSQLYHHPDDQRLSWQSKYCRAQTHANWRMGSVQRAVRISDHDGSRILSVKLKHDCLATLSENNRVNLYRYLPDSCIGFQLQTSWDFGYQTASIVECIDVLPEINILVVAMRGSKCIFYDISHQQSSSEPIQVLKGGSHPWFMPDSIALTQDYFAVSGRKPSAVFIWNWRKGVRLSNRAFDNQPHSVYISGTHIITASVDGLLHTFDILDLTREPTTFTLPPCNMPCLTYDGSVNMVLAPYASRRIHQFHWDPSSPSRNVPNHPTPSFSDTHQPRSPPPQKSLSSSVYSSIFKRKSAPHTSSASSSKRSGAASGPSSSSPRKMGLRRHSSYNDYGYACQARTAQYISKMNPSVIPVEVPNFSSRLQLSRSIRTTPLGWTAHKVVSVAIHNERVATVNRYGDIAIFALNGTTAAHVTSPKGERVWIDERTKDNFRDEDELSDGYDFIRGRLAMGSMGIVYGSRSGCLWWLDLGCRSDSDTASNNLISSSSQCIVQKGIYDVVILYCTSTGQLSSEDTANFAAAIVRTTYTHRDTEFCRSRTSLCIMRLILTSFASTSNRRP